MSFLFGGNRPQPSSAEKIALAEAELELIQDMYQKYALPSPTISLPSNYRPFPLTTEISHPLTSTYTHRLATSCTSKCLPKDYREADLNKGESVCIDRCVAKYMDVNIKIGEKMQADAMARAGQAAPGGGMFGR